MLREPGEGCIVTDGAQNAFRFGADTYSHGGQCIKVGPTQTAVTKVDAAIKSNSGWFWFGESPARQHLSILRNTRSSRFAMQMYDFVDFCGIRHGLHTSTLTFDTLRSLYPYHLRSSDL